MDLLIIDDDTVDRMSALRTLKASGLQLETVDQTASAEEGVALATARHYDAILLDYQLPPANGIEVLQALRRIPRFSTAVLMLSHSHDEALALQCVEAGAQDFLMKSEVTAIRLKRAILMATERYQLEQKVRESHEQMRRLAEEDSLTGLSNRYYFDRALNEAIFWADAHHKSLALLLLDLDKFKDINDTLGHVAGDQFLQMVAQRLKSSMRKDDELCRLGGDEFAVLVPDLSSVDEVEALVARIFAAMTAPAVIEQQELAITLSLGVAMYPDCADDTVELMKCADVAMYRAKAMGRNQAQFYSRHFHDQVESRIRIEQDLKKALDQDQLVLFYQPQVDARSMALVGVEALIRWDHPDIGLIPPDEFIPVAEESDLIHELGQWVLDRACQQFSEWRQTSPKPFTFSIAANLSARQLKDTGLVDHLTQCLNRYQIPANQLELELTESSLESSLAALDMLKSLSSLGVNLALDDFGTGYSSLAHLKEYPFNILKIDKAFVQHIESEDQASLLKAICSFAHSLGYETVAEGIETAVHRDICADLGVKRLQGYFFSRPLPASELEARWIQSSPSILPPMKRH
ncbi:diguanylate cyclase [Terasakiispira papahanaumokuakeensis]|uniref:Diguanylate cyclase n=1 Tax=Terasakiispira papahanaumokuakeensis TaxID=197479 RepID=A0A1E2V7S3_9GAMM|nr:GGDEF domain-containing response regulator [Terasakiispira papahanaumokuakeensis]ODC03031.1 diguanylate cyclase [Terasakiispira papahanaumokuakeensis]